MKSIFVVTGSDTFRIAEWVKLSKQQFKTNSTFEFDRWHEALEAVRSCNLFGSFLAIWYGSEVTKIQEESLLNVTVAPNNCLILVLERIDKRTKIGKWLATNTEFVEFNTIPFWDSSTISHELCDRAARLQLPLPTIAQDYLTLAIGNDVGRIQAELEKLAIYRGSGTITMRDVKVLVPNLQSSAFAIADALRLQNYAKVIAITQAALGEDQHPLQIIGAVMSKWQQWLCLKAALVAGIRSDIELAKAANVRNPKQCYYLKQDVSGIDLFAICRVAVGLFDLQCKYKSGLDPQNLPYYLSVLSCYRAAR